MIHILSVCLLAHSLIRSFAHSLIRNRQVISWTKGYLSYAFERDCPVGSVRKVFRQQMARHLKRINRDGACAALPYHVYVPPSQQGDRLVTLLRRRDIYRSTNHQPYNQLTSGNTAWPGGRCAATANMCVHNMVGTLWGGFFDA